VIAPSELLRVILAPVIVSAVVAGLGRWRKSAWAMPLAAGAGFLTGYALIGVPRLPPRDGTDWLFWLAFPLTVLGIVDALVGKRWGWSLGAAAGAVAWVILAPLVPGAVTRLELVSAALAFALAGAAVTFCIQLAEPRVAAAAVVAGLCVALGATAVVVMSSNLRIVGVYGIAASAALGPVAVFAGTLSRSGRAVAIVCIPLLAGLLVGGRYYTEPGVSGLNLVTLRAAPALLLLGAVIPGNKDWVRGIVAALAVATAVSVVTAPTAMAAKKTAETVDVDDPYASYK